MTGHGEFTAAAQAESIHRGDDRFPERLEAPKDSLSPQRSLLAIEGVLTQELADIGPRHKSLGAGSGEDDRAHPGISGRGVDRLTELGDDLVVEGIELVRPVDGDDGDPVPEVIEEGGVANAIFRERGGRRGSGASGGKLAGMVVAGTLRLRRHPNEGSRGGGDDGDQRHTIRRDEDHSSV
jgi:hypothetical protein